MRTYLASMLCVASPNLIVTRSLLRRRNATCDLSMDSDIGARPTVSIGTAMYSSRLRVLEMVPNHEAPASHPLPMMYSSYMGLPAHLVRMTFNCRQCGTSSGGVGVPYAGVRSYRVLWRTSRQLPRLNGNQKDSLGS
ncbi:hypothetical protein LY78DRAFT_403401 [Colletotrichum sublineola]|nr:hypothetical protein LY78DRAFT_403401 [Colletotrichum sublineola]